MSDNVETMAYANQTPWHNLGTKVADNLTPLEMMDAAGLNWSVVHKKSFVELDSGERVYTGQDALVRNTDNKILTIIPAEWKEVQNLEAFEFFHDFCKAGDMKMETAGSLKGGQIVWVLARIADGFVLPGQDEVQPYMLFTLPHKYGFSTSVSWTAIRVVCHNTLKLSLSSTSSDKIIKVSHRRDFIAEEAKVALGISAQKLAKYKEMAEYLAATPAKGEDIVEYFKRVFPVLTSHETARKEISKPAQKCLEILDTQPGTNMSAGSWWQPYNAVTFYTDHVAGKSADIRLSSSWYGENAKRKIKALQLACDMATVA